MEEKKALVNGGYPLHTFEDLKELYSAYITNKDDLKSIESAYLFILEKHKDQYRKSGEPYYHHLLEVAYILAELHVGPATIVAGLLHDVVEDTDTPLSVIEENWGSDVRKIVDAVTKIQRLKLSKRDNSEFEAEDHKKIFIGMAQDVRVIIVKLADRLHNLRTLGSLSRDRQIALSKETVDVFIPIAHRLGINVIKSEMEDICLRYLEPEKYDHIQKLLASKSKSKSKSLDALSKRIADALFENHIKFEMKSRIKSIASIYQKMYRKGKEFDEIYDILALRIIVESELNCYEVLGLIHQMYRPIPGRFKDYIAMPKPNMYQSLHTSIISGDGNIYEVQIRTKEMDAIAESGVAAHWAYKEGHYNSQKEQQEIENQLHWFRDFVSMSDGDNKPAKEYMDNLTNDIFNANVYVFTPKGKVIELPKGATPLDFAYRIHSKVGESTVGAIVNGAIAPLNHELQTGDVVEIKTSKNPPGPNEKWLDFAVTSSAKSAIKKYLYKKNASLMRDEYTIKGKEALFDAFKDRGITNEAEIMDLVDNKKLLDNFDMQTVEDLFVAIVNRKPTAGAVIEYLNIKRDPQILTGNTKVKHFDGGTPVYCKGVDKIAISLASCCNPIPGDQIMGYITRGKGVSVHRINCPNIANEKVRLIPVYWHDDLKDSTYQVDAVIEASDRESLVADVLGMFSSQKCSVTSLNAKLSPHTRNTTIAVTIYVRDAKHLETVFSAILSLKGVIRINRIIH